MVSAEHEQLHAEQVISAFTSVFEKHSPEQLLADALPPTPASLQFSSAAGPQSDSNTQPRRRNQRTARPLVCGLPRSSCAVHSGWEFRVQSLLTAIVSALTPYTSTAPARAKGTQQ